MSEIIRTERLSKHFKNVHAVDDLSLNIRKGEIYGFLGLNGAGKTTTIRMLLGLIRPTSGTSYIYDRQVSAGSTDIWRSIGYMVEMPNSYPDLSVRENLEIIRRLRFLTDKSAIDRIVDKLHLREYIDIKSKNLSQGNSQRLGLAKALIHNPQILILDEPSNGLDPAGIVEIRELLKDMTLNYGVTVFISSHILGEISKLVSRIGIIHEGRLMEELNAEQLDKLCKKRLIIDAKDKNAVISVLHQNGYSASLTENGKLEILNGDAIDHPDKIAGILVHAGVPPTMLIAEEEDLESFFLRTIGAN
ncbi:MAG: ABC transporter ATP-binding protein [Bacteroidetes bacterium]|nr:ABC transporter ATP-binding protein [Bacteroidota bacterium]